MRKLLFEMRKLRNLLFGKLLSEMRKLLFEMRKLLFERRKTRKLLLKCVNYFLRGVKRVNYF